MENSNHNIYRTRLVARNKIKLCISSQEKLFPSQTIWRSNLL